MNKEIIQQTVSALNPSEITVLTISSGLTLCNKKPLCSSLRNRRRQWKSQTAAAKIWTDGRP